MLLLDPEKCYQLPPKAKRIVINDAFPKDWLDQLAIICGKSLSLSSVDSERLKKDFQRYAGENSAYSVKKELIDGLKDLYCRLSDKQSPFSDSEKLAMATKLSEDVNQCTVGFHNRVNEIVSGFYFSETLDSLLLQIRRGIVDNVARKTMNIESYSNQS